MPSLKAATGGKITGCTPCTADFAAVWSILDPYNVVYGGNGIYSYAGAGGFVKGDVGLVRTISPLDSSRSGGVSSFEIVLSNTGT